MKKRQTYLSIEKIWEDSDLKELLIEANNGYFSGRTRIYTDSESILELSQKMEGFPKQIGDAFEYRLGQPDVYGIADFRFKSVDGKGHCEFELELKGTIGFDEEEGEVKVRFKVDPAEIDQIQKDLTSLGKELVEQVVYQGHVNE